MSKAIHHSFGPSLESTFVRLQYIERVTPHSDALGMAGILKTGIILTDNYEIEIGLVALEVTGGNIAGGADAESIAPVRFFNYSSKIYLDQGPTDARGRLTGTNNSFPINEYHLWKFGNRYVYKDGTQVLSGTALTNIGHTEAACMFAKCQVTKFSVKVDGVLRFDGYPVRCGSILYFYDRVTGNLFELQTDSRVQYVAGPDVAEQGALPYPYLGTSKLLLCLDGVFNNGLNNEHSDLSNTWTDLSHGYVLTQYGNSTPFAFFGNRCQFNTTQRSLRTTSLDFSGTTGFTVAAFAYFGATWGEIACLKAPDTYGNGNAVEVFPHADNTGPTVDLNTSFTPHGPSDPGILHLTLTYDGTSTAKFYVNGVLHSTSTSATKPTWSSSTWSQLIPAINRVIVGADWNSSNSYPPSDSALYSLSCYAECMDASQVLKLCNDTYAFYGVSLPGYRYFKFSVTAKRGSDYWIQLSEIKFLNNGTPITLPSTVTVSAMVNGTAATPGSVDGNVLGRYPTAQGPEKLIDGDTSSGGSKLCISNKTSIYPLEVIFDFQDNIILPSTFTGWCWYTAGDESARDPTSFSMSASRDGTSWATLDSVSNATITTSRNALAYTGTFNWN